MAFPRLNNFKLLVFFLCLFLLVTAYLNPTAQCASKHDLVGISAISHDQATYYLILEEVPCYLAKNVPSTLQQEFDLYYEGKKSELPLPSSDFYQW